MFGPPGVSGGLDWAGSNLVAGGRFRAGPLLGPMELVVEAAHGRDEPYVYLARAQLDGGASGLLVIEAGRLQLASGTIRGAEPTNVWAGEAVELALRGTTVPREHWDHPLPRDWSDASKGIFFSEAVKGDWDRVRVSGFVRAALFNGSVRMDLSAPFTASGSGWWMAAGSRLVVPSVSLGVDRGVFITGAMRQPVTMEGGAPVGVTMVTGVGGKVVASPGRLTAGGGFRVTQAYANGTLMLSSHVEFVAHGPMKVTRGSNASLTTSYREGGLRGDAVVKKVTVSGTGAPYATVYVGAPGFDEGVGARELWSSSEKASWSQGRFSMALPAWIPAGGVGLFETRFQAPQAPGSYQVRVDVDGINFPDQSIMMEFVVD